jgi:hypothetical protein
MPLMTATFPELIVRAALGDPGLHSLAEVVVVICLVAMLVEREMLRHRHGLWSRTVLRSLTAVAVPLVIAWGFIAVERFIELAGG